jgi:hypothetical protein
MRFINSFALLVFFIAGCGNDAPNKLEDAFILSMQKNDFNILKKFLPDVAYYKSLGDKMPFRENADIKKFIDESNQRIKDAWQNAIFNAAEKKIDLNRVMIRDVFYYDPFKRDEASEAMIINYEYKGKVWDDIQFIIGRYNTRTYLLTIPNPTRAFSMADAELRATNEAKAWIETQKPDFKKNIDEVTRKIINDVKEHNIESFAQQIIYRGDEERRRWRSGVNINDSLEEQQAKEFMQKVSSQIEKCDAYETGEIMTKRQSEGVWIVLPMKCGDKIISFAYLRVNNKLMLGDTDSEARQ